MQSNVRPIRVNKFNELSRKRKPRNIRFSPWAINGMKKERKTLIQNQGDFVVSNALFTSMKLAENSERYSESELIDYLKDNYKMFKRILSKDALESGYKGTIRIDILKEEVPMFFSKMRAENIVSSVEKSALRYAKRVAKAVIEEESPNVRKILLKKVQSYFIARKIPINSKFIDLVLVDYASRSSFAEDVFQRKMNFRFLEKEYLMLRKETRKRELMFRQGSNELIRVALAGLHPTNRQISIARNWILRENKNYAEEFTKRINLLISNASKEFEGKISAIGLGGSKVGISLNNIEEIAKIGDELRTRQKTDLIKFMLSTMKVKNKSGKGNLVVKSNFKQKIGAREDRMRAYSVRPKGSSEVRTNMAKMESVKSAVIKTGADFNSVSYSINEIRKSNVELGKMLDTFLKNKFLSRSSVEKLYIKGNLAQVSFFRAINEFKFVEKFGSSSVDSLAKVISTIGPEYPPVGLVSNSVRDGSGIKIIDFLVKNKLAEDTHRGGACIGLTR